MAKKKKVWIHSPPKPPEPKWFPAFLVLVLMVTNAVGVAANDLPAWTNKKEVWRQEGYLFIVAVGYSSPNRMMPSGRWTTTASEGHAYEAAKKQARAAFTRHAVALSGNSSVEVDFSDLQIVDHYLVKKHNLVEYGGEKEWVYDWTVYILARLPVSAISMSTDADKNRPIPIVVLALIVFAFCLSRYL